MTTATLNQLFYKRVKIFLWTLKKSLVIKNTNISKKKKSKKKLILNSIIILITHFDVVNMYKKLN